MKLLTLIVVMLPTFSVAAEERPDIVGSVTAVTGRAEIVQQDGGRSQAIRRMSISQSDQLETGEFGSLQIRFIDGALVLLGCNSTLKINRYSSNGEDTVELILARGKIRTISGTVHGDDYHLDTDLGTIRVTIPRSDLEVTLESTDTMLLGVYSGSAEIEANSRKLTLGIGGDFDFAKVIEIGVPVGIVDQPQNLQVNLPCN